MPLACAITRLASGVNRPNEPASDRCSVAIAPPRVARIPGYSYNAGRGGLEQATAASDVNAGGLLLMAGLAVVLAAIGLVVFVRRDIGAPCVLPERFLPERRPPRMLPMRSWSIQSLMTRSLRGAAGPAIG
jgi:hypothetical protein